MGARRTVSVVLYGLLLLLPKIVSAILMLFYVRVLTPEEYGIFGIIGALLLVLTSTSDLGLPEALIRNCWEKTEDSGERMAYFSSLLRGSGLLNLAILPLLAGVLIIGWSQTRILSQMWVFIPLLLATAYFDRATEIMAAICRALNRADLYAVGKFTQALIIGISGIALVFVMHVGVVGTLLALLLGRVGSAITYQLILKRHYALKRVPTNWRDIRDALKFGLPLIPHRLAAWLRQPSLKIVLAHYASLSMVGQFSFAASLAALPMFVSTAIDYELTPLYFDKRSKDEGLFLQKFKRFVLVFLGVLFPIWFVLITVSSELIPLIGSKQFEGASSLCAILLCSTFVRFQVPFLYRQIGYLKATQLIPIVTWSAAALSFLFTYLFIRDYGVTAVAWAIFASDAAALLGLSIIIRLRERLDYPLALSFCMTGVLCVLVLFGDKLPPTLHSSPLTARVLLVVLACALSYVACLRSEWPFIKKVLNG